MSPVIALSMLTMYLLTAEHLIHNAIMLRRVVAVVGGGEGPVRSETEREKAVLNMRTSQ